MVEVLGDVSGAAVANGSKQRLQTRAAKDSGWGRIFEMQKEHIALSKSTTAQTILRPEGRPDIALHNLINLSYRTR